MEEGEVKEVSGEEERVKEREEENDRKEMRREKERGEWKGEEIAWWADHRS